MRTNKHIYCSSNSRRTVSPRLPQLLGREQVDLSHCPGPLTALATDHESKPGLTGVVGLAWVRAAGGEGLDLKAREVPGPVHLLGGPA